MQVGTGTGLGHGNGGDHFPRDQLGQVFVFQDFTAVMQDVRRHDVRMQGEADAGQPQPPHLLDDHRTVEKIRTEATVLFRQMGAQHPRLPCLVPELTVDVTLLFPLSMKGHGLFFEEGSYAVAKQFVLGAEQGSWNHRGTCDYCWPKIESQSLSPTPGTGHWTHQPKNKTIQPLGDHFPL
ncbi:hypothetical protein D3C84_693350 [compost metagenome]